MGIVGAVLLCAGFSPSAYAKHGNAPHFRAKKYAGPFGGINMKPRKQKRRTGYYRSALTGQVMYGRPKR